MKERKNTQKLIRTIPKPLRGGIFLDIYNNVWREVTSSILADSGYGFHNNGFVLIKQNEKVKNNNSED